ncbi:MAG: glycoside hydrolase family 2 TIM barrel-domain containing protein [Lachnospiraceae bacterium]|nr:glycoside hydrolase family 2 TIM barrel-domain containing protein [Lachnospiraceae bacterium]
MTKRTVWNDGWEFTERPLGVAADTMFTEQGGWLTVDLPHDWLIYDAEDLYRDGEGWYRKSFSYVPSEERVLLRFDGVYMNCTVYVNSMRVYDWKYGYSAFEFDITDALHEGENTVYVQVRYQSPNSRWYSGAGIYRNVWLVTRPPVHLASDGVYVHTAEQAGDFLVTVVTEAECGAGTNLGDLSVADTAASKRAKGLNGKPVDGRLDGVRIRHRILSPDGEKAADSMGEVLTGSFATDTQKFTVPSPKRWDLKHPVLYTLVTELIKDDTVVDEIRQSIGFRTISFDTEEGFFLNGRHVKLYGVCEHHDLGCLGAAFNKKALRRQFEKLREMGVNAIRTSHNMPAYEFMELADEMGFLVLAEAFDMWERHKTPYDYATFFKEWYKADVASWIRRDRNHPSVIMWSIGNEIYDTHADEHGQDITKYLTAEVRLHDPLLNAPVTIGSNYMPWENAKKCAELVKYAGYNYGETCYEEHHEEHPDWYIYGSETGSTVQSRGIYRFPLEQSVLCDDDEQCSSLGNATTSWGAKSTEYCIYTDRDAKFSLGQFIWTGFDYIGEPTPYHTKNSYFGQIDTAGFFKDQAYIYQAEWTDYKEKPMVHIFPYWDFSAGQTVDVRICSNAPRVELFVNGVSKGDYAIDHANGTKLLGHWKVPYVPGEITAVAYDENGTEIARDTEHSFTDPARILLKPESTSLAADGRDLIFVEIGVEDADGYPVRNARNRIHVSVEGAGRLVGLDNGDSTDYDNYKATSRRLFSGKLLAVIAAKTEPGEIVVKATSVGLPEETVVLRAEPCTVPEGVSATEDNVTAQARWLALREAAEAAKQSSEEAGKETVAQWKKRMAEEVPVRRIDIVTEGTNRLNAGQSEVMLTAKLYPENATYRDISWRVTNNGGVDSNIAKLTDVASGASGMSKSEGLAYGNRVLLTALGDGEVRVRCNGKNGAEKIRLISDMDFVIEGIGAAYLNPYELVSGSLYTRHQGVVTNGNERGVATAREGKTTVTFDNVDFGEFGSDEITLPIFELGGDAVQIEIWEGAPGDTGSKHIDTVTYHVPSIWNTYQERTYKLPVRLKGVTALSFVTENKIHLKGFYFTKQEKAFAMLPVKENTSIYGDTFTVEEDAVTGIGNNVTIVFEGMDFGERGAERVTICGRSHLPKNTIHIRFNGEDGDRNEIAEFTGSETYTEQTFAFSKVAGKNTVNFVFLPGCEFDFKWFRFE